MILQISFPTKLHNKYLFYTGFIIYLNLCLVINSVLIHSCLIQIFFVERPTNTSRVPFSSACTFRFLVVVMNIQCVLRIIKQLLQFQGYFPLRNLIPWDAFCLSHSDLSSTGDTLPSRYCSVSKVVTELAQLVL